MDREKTSFATMGRTASGISIKFLGSSHGDSDAGGGGGGGGVGRNLSLRAMGRDYGVSTPSSGYNTLGNSGGQPASSGGYGTPVKQRHVSSTNVDQEEVNHQLNAVKLKLEERRRKIEEEKKKMEQLMVKQREKVGQEAFLRAVSRGIRRVESDVLHNEQNDSGVKQEILDLAHNVSKVGGGGGNVAAKKAGFSLRLSAGDAGVGSPGGRGMPSPAGGGGAGRGDDIKTPDVEAMDISRMSDSLQSLQSDIQRLALQQSQIQNIMNNQRGKETPERKSFFISEEKPQHRGFFINEARNSSPSSASPTTEEIKTATTVRRTWGTPQPMILPHGGGGRNLSADSPQQQTQHHSPHYPAAPHHPPQHHHDYMGGMQPSGADQFPVHHVPERPTLMGQSAATGYGQYHVSQGQPQYPGYGGGQPPLNGQGAAPPVGYPQQPQYGGSGRPMSAPGYMIPTVSTAAYHPPQATYTAYPEPYATTTAPHAPGPGDGGVLYQEGGGGMYHPHPAQQMPPQTYEAPGTVRINLSRNNSFNRQPHTSGYYGNVVVTSGSAAVNNYAEPVYAEPPSFGGAAAMQQPSRPRSTSGFTQVEERGHKLGDKPSLNYLQHRRTAPRSTGPGSPMSELPNADQSAADRQVENVYESVDHGYTVNAPRSRSVSPARTSNQTEHYYETLDQQQPRSYNSPRTSLTVVSRSGRPSLEASPPPRLPTTTSPYSSHIPSTTSPYPATDMTSKAPQPEVEPEMTSSTIETLSAMKTETLGDTNDAKGFVISFDNDSPVRPKPVLRPKKTSRRESLTSAISQDSNSSDRRDGFSTPSSVAAKTPESTLDKPLPASSAVSSFGGNGVGNFGGNTASHGGTSVGSSGEPSRRGSHGLGAVNSSHDELDLGTSPGSSLTNHHIMSALSPQPQATELESAVDQVSAAHNNSEKCVLCELSEIHQPILKLCSKCTNVLKANIHSPDALLRCSKVGECDPEEYCPKCMIEKSKSLDMFDKIREAFQDSNPSAAASKMDEKKMEWVQMMTLKRKQQAEESRAKREEEARRRREEEEAKKAEQAKKKEEEKRRREEIFEQYKIKKELEKEEKNPSHPPPTSSNRTGPRMRPRSAGAGKPRPRTIHVDSEDLPDGRSGVVRSASGLRGSHSNLNISSLNRSRHYRRGSNTSLHDEELYAGNSGLRGLGHIGRSKSSSVSNLGPGSLPLGLRRGPPGSHRSDYGGHRSEYGGHRGGEFDDGASDISSTTSGYRSGRVSARLYREPVSKSNRPIVMNAIEFVVFPGAVNRDTRMRVLEEIERCDCPHFLLLFRDSRLQFRALYAFYPDTEEVFKIYGNGPKQITDNMIENYYKYNSGGKKFTQIHTKHLTVTIDAFTIHNSLWLGKKTRLPDKKGLPLVI